jgi:hypothetical protein
MTRKSTSTARARQREHLSDLTFIHGIGPAIKKQLHKAGISTIAELAESSVDAIAAILPNMSAKQVTKQGWIPQARKLVSGKAKTSARKKELATPTSHQHYQNFTFEFLLDEKNRTHRLRLVHVQSGDVDTWAGWDAGRLIDFLAKHTGARLPNMRSATSKAAIPELPIKLPDPTGQPSERMHEMASITLIQGSNEKINLQPELETAQSIHERPISVDLPPVESLPKQLVSADPAASPSNQIRLLQWKTFLDQIIQSSPILPHDQSFETSLNVDITNTSLAKFSQLDFTLFLYAKKVGSGLRQVIGEVEGTIPYANILDLTICNASLPAGLYRLEALLTLTPGGAFLSARSSVRAMFSGGLFQFY